MASLLLTSDIKGYVEQPAYYFNNVSEKTRADLDALMLTQGYRRFEWKSVLSGATVADKYPHQTAFNISGTVFSKKGKPLANCKVELVDYENALNNVDALTDENGHFKFDEIVYPDSSSFFIYARGDKFNKDAIIKMDPHQEEPSVARYKNAADFNIVNIAENKTAYEKSSKQLFAEQMKFGLGNHAIKLKEVVIKDKFKTVKYSANTHPDLTDQVLTGKDIGSGCRYFVDCLQGRVAGVSFKGGKPYSNRTDRPMLTIVDGIPDPEGMVLSRLNSNDVEGVEVIRGGKVSIYGFGSGNGVIFVTTRRTLTTGRELTKASADAPQRIEKGVIRYKPKGVYTARVFYSPLYDANTNHTLADLRTTIFWQPNVVTNDGKASVEFANAGSTGTYRVVVEGISSEGSIGRQVFRYKVE
ncbi:TonB-dependent receptor plug domain-containing protein [Mucilaginibacter rigui]|uniref:TonB-dependent receptor plug domain-containing protein n=2 Tax=Mucilaginibacter rigui TaxID=534635 RepID=A0ABR7X8Y1_9SPHI|nr:TonB-dependent receptor plug domain-containing protein [Mucilaginibacter rigui]